MIPSSVNAERLAAALNEIDDLFGANDFEIYDYVLHYGRKFDVDLDAFNAVEVCLPAPVCNQYRYIIPVGTEGDRSVVMANRISGYWEALSQAAMPSFVLAFISDDAVVTT